MGGICGSNGQRVGTRAGRGERREGDRGVRDDTIFTACLYEPIDDWLAVCEVSEGEGRGSVVRRGREWALG